MPVVTDNVKSRTDDSIVDGLLAWLCSAYPSVQVDLITSIEKDKNLTALKNVCRNEFIFGSKLEHFNYPHSLILESMVQASAALTMHDYHTESFALWQGVVAKIENAEFNSRLKAGDQMIINVDVISKKPYLWRLRTEALKFDQMIATADIYFVSG